MIPMRIRKHLAALLLTPLFVASSSLAQTQATPADDPLLDVATAHLSRALFLRCLCVADTLVFDATGHLETAKTHPEDWTLDGVDLTRVSRKGAEGFEFEGFRSAIRWNDDIKEFRRQQLKTEPIRIVVNGAMTPEALRHAMASIFSLGIDHGLQQSLPPYWQHYFDPRTPWPEDGLKGTQVYTPGSVVAGETVAAPAVQNKPKVDFTPEAARDKITGPSILHVIVDANGVQHRISVFQPLGYGLDAKAVEALEKAKFAPVKVAGKQVAASVLVREEFKVETISSLQ